MRKDRIRRRQRKRVTIPSMDGVEFLSSEWIDALNAAASGRAFPADVGPFTFVREVTGLVRDTDGELCRVEEAASSVRVAFAFTDGRLSVSAVDDGHGDFATLVSDYLTAVCLAQGDCGVQESFEAGRLRLRGPVRQIVENKTLIRALDDVFADVRQVTRFTL